MSTGYFMDDIAIEYREEIEVLRQKDEAHTEARMRMASEIESLTAENERLRNILQRTLEDINENYNQFIGMPLLVRNSTIEKIRETMKELTHD